MGTITQVNYLKAFRKYWDTIIREAGTPIYEAIISTFNISLFGRDFIPVQVNTTHGGDGESEDEMEQYHLMLKQDSGPPLFDPPNTDTGVLLAQSSPAIIVQELRPTSISSTTAEPEAEEEHPVMLKPKRRPVSTKRVPPPPPPMDLSDPVPGSSVFEDPTLENPDPPVRGGKKGGWGKKTPASEQPARPLRKRAK